MHFVGIKTYQKPDHIDSINSIIKQHKDKIPKKYNDLPIKQTYLENNKYYLFCT